MSRRRFCFFFSRSIIWMRWLFLLTRIFSNCLRILYHRLPLCACFLFILFNSNVYANCLINWSLTPFLTQHRRLTENFFFFVLFCSSLFPFHTDNPIIWVFLNWLLPDSDTSEIFEGIEIPTILLSKNVRVSYKAHMFEQISGRPSTCSGKWVSNALSHLC